MEQKKIDRISQLSRLSRERELTEEGKTGAAVAAPGNMLIA